MKKKIKVIKKCCECGKRDELHYFPEVEQDLIKRNVCFSCGFWQEKLDIKDLSTTARMGGQYYVIGEESQDENSFRGFDGRKFKIKFDDGRIVETTNLWGQGEIPKHFRERLPDNAKFVE